MLFTHALATLLLTAALGNAKWDTRDAKNSIVNELGAKLSDGASIILNGEEGFAEKKKRWQAWANPHISAVVGVRNERDVQETIRYATKHSTPFLAISGTHASTLAHGSARNTIQIDLRALNHITISPTSQSSPSYVTIGGGLKAKALISHLWAHNLQTVTGGCECVGLTAVALGGGHGFLQGYYGLLADQVMSMRVVLANGEVVNVSEEENAELFWAMRGAGHNFGVVVEMRYRVYDIEEDGTGGRTWSWEAFTLPATEANVERVYRIAGEGIEGQPRGMMQYGVVMLDPELSPVPVIRHMIAYNGPLSKITKWTKRYHELEDVRMERAEGTYIDVPRWMMIHEEGMVCNIQDYMPGAGVMRFPVDVEAYNLTALVATVNRFVEVVSKGPEFAGGFMMLEQYSSEKVREVDASKSVFPSRKTKLLLAPAVVYQSVDKETGKKTGLDEKARELGEELRGYLVDGARDMGGSYSYVNYAYGGESLEEMYGKENLERLLALKRRYDPDNKFGFYAPLASAKEDDGHSEL